MRLQNVTTRWIATALLAGAFGCSAPKAPDATTWDGSVGLTARCSPMAPSSNRTGARFSRTVVR
jgi:hypothetical protein